MPIKNSNLRKANGVKNDEFYTQLSDIENEIRYYKDHFKGKTVLCNCDDPRVSNFFHYFAYNFEHLGLKRLITTCYKNQKPDLFSTNNSEKAVYLVYEGDKNGNHIPDAEEIGVHKFKGDGDFRSDECIELLKQADIVVTNPPFSLFREYISQLIEYEKSFIILGNMNAISYKEIFPLIKNNQVWMGASLHGSKCNFLIPDSYEGSNVFIDKDGKKKAKINNAIWFTNLDLPKRHENIILYKNYDSSIYKKYDYFNAINVDRVSDIPCDYEGIMGVPITFLDKYNPDQFEIIDGLNRYTILDVEGKNDWAKANHIHLTSINGVSTYFRILIRRKK